MKLHEEPRRDAETLREGIRFLQLFAAQANHAAIHGSISGQAENLLPPWALNGFSLRSRVPREVEQKQSRAKPGPRIDSPKPGGLFKARWRTQIGSIALGK
jgi:hypothetical protein